jgi:hypothetical protein
MQETVIYWKLWFGESGGMMRIHRDNTIVAETRNLPISPK